MRVQQITEFELRGPGRADRTYVILKLVISTKEQKFPRQIFK